MISTQSEKSNRIFLKKRGLLPSVKNENVTGIILE
jgi:hypothetical protein